MFSSFTSTSDGCGSCATLDDAFGSQVRNPASNVYAQNNVMQQQANNIVPGSVAIPVTQPAINNNVAVMAQQQAQQQTNAQAAMNNMVKKAVNNVATNVANNTVGNVATPVANNNLVGKATPQVQVNIPSRLILLNFGFIILAALSCNECFKYYINRAIQTAEGQPHYYLGYAVVMGVLAVVVYIYSKRNSS